MSPVDPILAAPEAAAPLWAAVFRTILALVLLCGGAAAWFYWRKKIQANHRHLEVVDRAFLARGASVALLRVDEQRLLVGVSADGVRLIRNLEPKSARPAKREFARVLAETTAAGDRR